MTLGYSPGDPTDRVSTFTRVPTGGTAQQITVSYDASLVSGSTWSSGGASQAQYAYTYDHNFFPTGSTLTSSTDVVTTTRVNDADGFPTAFGPFTWTRAGPGGRPTKIADGTGTLALGYDALARVNSRILTVNGTATYTETLDYDDGGRISQIVEVVPGITRTVSYGYDANSQLTTVTKDGALAEQYDYDANGNRNSVQIGSSSPITATYDVQDRLIQQASTNYQFNQDGFLTQRGSDTFQYSARGELLSAKVRGQTVTYAYDALGRRTGRTDATGTTQYFYGNPGNAVQLTAMRDAESVLSTFYYDPDGLLIAIQRGPARYYVATDPVGTPRLMTDANGAVVLALDYDSYGNVLPGGTVPSFAVAIGFAGGLVDPTTGLVRFGFRDYDPVVGRWTARDPVLFNGDQANLYVYVANNPIGQRDPLGEFCVGGSAYDGVGGGIQVCWNDQGYSICSEIGLGTGGSFQAGAGGLAQTDMGLGASLSADCNGFGAGLDFKYTICKGLTYPKINKVTLLGYGVDPESGSASTSAGALGRLYGTSSSPCSASAKVYLKICKQFN
jgi:RHS repeat-associated protein